MSVHPFCRIFQAVRALFLRICRKAPPRTLSGEGCLGELPSLLEKKGIRRPLLLTTAGTLRRGAAEPFLSGCREKGIPVSVFDAVTPDPTEEEVLLGEARYREDCCDALVALGGGSVLDCAKAVGARLARPGKPLIKMCGVLRVRRRLPLLFAVPTTAGTGSEVTAAAVLTFRDEKTGAHKKAAVSDFCLIPKVAVLDPALTATLPPLMTAECGMDALTHAIEAYTNRFASSYVKKTAEKAVSLIFKNLPAAVKNPADPVAGAAMLSAAYLSGLAFTNNFVGTVHALAHAVGGLYGVPHGRACAVLLVPVLRAYGKPAERKLAALSRAAGLSGKKTPAPAAAEAFLSEIEKRNRSFGIPAVFPELRPEDFGEIISRAQKETFPAYPVPVFLDRNALFHILALVCPAVS